MTELSEGDKMALLAEWVPIENAYRQALEKQDERSDVSSPNNEPATGNG